MLKKKEKMTQMDFRKPKYWQHEHPINCPEGHLMIWLGSAFWGCPECNKVYVQITKETVKEGRRT
jgi:uncharacterized protein with PIN domain